MKSSTVYGGLYLSFNSDTTVCSLDHTDIVSSITCHKMEKKPKKLHIILQGKLEVIKVADFAGCFLLVNFDCHLVDIISKLFICSGV